MTASERAAPSGPPGVPVLGNTLQFARDPFGFYEECRAYGDLVPYSVAGRQFYMVMHPDDVERVLSTDHRSFRKGEFQRRQLGRVLGEDGLLTSEGDRWREQRQRVQPAFGPERIGSYVSTMTDCAEAAVDRWRGRERVAVDEEMRRVTVRILARTLFGTDIGEHVETIAEAMTDIGAQAGAPTLTVLLPEWLPTPWSRRAQRGVDAIDGVIEALVDQRASEDLDRREDLLSTLLVAHREGDITRGTLRDQLVTFLLAGHETTSLALTYTWYLLAENPETRDQLHEELDEALGGEPPTMADLEDLAYTEHVVTEAMRLYPPVYRVVREACEPVELGGHTVEAGSRLVLPQWNVHRDERWYDDPGQFRPERWAADRGRPEYAYFPFGGGPRRCIGMRFAKLEAQLVLATVASRYELDRAERASADGAGGDEPPANDGDIDLVPGVTVSPAEPVEMTVTER